MLRNNNPPICQSCKETESGVAQEENLLSVEKALSTTAINMETPEPVHCGIPGCSWLGAMSSLEDHRHTCEYVLENYGQATMCRTLADQYPGSSSGGNPRIAENELQKPSGLSCCEEGCRFSRIGCSFKGNPRDQTEHEKNAAGRHLLLLLQHVRPPKASSYPRGDGPNSPLMDTNLLGLKIQEAGGGCSSSAVPVEEGEVRWHTFLRRAQRVSWLESKLQVFENISSVLSKELATSRQKIVAFRGQRGLDQDMIRGLELKVDDGTKLIALRQSRDMLLFHHTLKLEIADLQHCLMQKDVALTRLEERVHRSAQVSYDGVFLWKITDVHQKCYEAICGKMNSFESPAFYTSRYGYKLCMRTYLNGEGRGKGTHISLFLVLLKGDYDVLLPWPFTPKITFMLLSQDNGDNLVSTLHPDVESTSFQRPVTDANEAIGFSRFVPLAKLQSPKYTYLKEGILFLKCIVEGSS